MFARLKNIKFISFMLVASVVASTFFLEDKGKIVPETSVEKGVHVFFQPDCPHCKKALAFFESIDSEFPDIQLYLHNINHQEELESLMIFANNAGVLPHKLAVPMIFIDGRYIIGFESAATTGERIKEWMTLLGTNGEGVEPSLAPDVETLELPFIGTVNLYEMALPLLAITLGIVDGFNPCAMWVLVYLISLIIGQQDVRKIWIIVGTFLFASGVLYFLFMTAWLNVFLTIGYIRIVSLLIGGIALYIALNNLYSYFFNKGEIVCEVDTGKKQKTMQRMQEVVMQPIGIASIAGIVLLAFAVNSIEFVCSAALPAIFTHVLSTVEMPTLYYYLYILLYDLFFLLDDIIIFSLAVFTVTKFSGEKYVKYCKLIGGVLLGALGVLILYFPQYLH